MKNIIKNITLCGCLVLGMGMTSCEDMMTVDTGDKAYINANDTLYSYLGIMRAMQDVAERQIVLGEIRGDLVSSSEYATDTLHAISNFENPKDQSCSMLCVSDYYNVINNCNFYIYNCDTSTVRANVKYMIPEYTQVKAIRAWAYLQLVKNYKEVPYITEPVKNLDVIKNFDYSHNLVNKDNLIDKLLEDGLANMVDINYPSYGKTNEPWGKWNNGATDVSARNCFIPIRLVLGDAYLLRGSSKSDYENAAFYYYSFLRKEKNPLIKSYCTMIESPEAASGYLYKPLSGNPWDGFTTEYGYSEENEIITLIPGSANAGIGKMLPRVAEVFGYNPSSSQSTIITIHLDEQGNETSRDYSAGGAIMVNPTYKRQYYPSYAFDNVNLSQQYVTYYGISSSSENKIARYYEQADARENYSYKSVYYEKDLYKLCAKVADLDQYYYCIPIYRKTLIWLRLAEALNRAGYPEFAFAILKDGLNKFTLPSVEDVTKNVTKNINGVDYAIWTNEDNDTIFYDSATKDRYKKEDGELVKVTGSLTGYTANTYTQRELTYNSIESMYYVTDTLKLQKFLSKFSFTDDVWQETYGIHARGGGFGYLETSSSASAKEWGKDGDYITTNISGRRDTVFYDYKAMIERKLDGKKFENATEDDIINAIEDVIVDELALETAFEGNRFYDLVRVAEHKNQSGYKGTEWLAKKIANRNSKQATKNSPAIPGFDANLYSKLQNQKNWYFTLPAWK